MEKKIVIDGKSNRYQVNKLIRNTKDEIKKNILSIDDKYFEAREQLNIINGVYIDLDKHVEGVIKKKISGYKQQDKLKEVLDETKFITYTQTVDLLKSSECKCSYCHVPLLLFYKTKNDGDQWTLDRIDNTIGHNFGNVICSCLDCNIQKKDRNHDKFMFSKNLTVKKI